MSLHNHDFYKWTLSQAHFLKTGDYKKLDIDHLIEEMESLGNSEKSKLESHLTILLMHLLKIKFQPAMHTRSWDLSIKNSRYHAIDTYKDNPSLKQYLPKIFKNAYFTARLKAMDETGLEEKVFPLECPWTIEEIMKEE